MADTEALEAKIRNLREARKTYGEVAEECGLTECQVAHIIKKAKLTRPRPTQNDHETRIKYLHAHCKELPCLKCGRIFQAEHSPTTGRRIHWLCAPCKEFT